MMKLRRRHFLRGLGGVAVALPFLDSLRSTPVWAKAEGDPRRFVAFFQCNGVLRQKFRPSGPYGPLVPDALVGTALEPLSHHVGSMLVARGIHTTPKGYNPSLPGDDHQKGMGHMLTASPLASGSLFATGISVDQAIANAINPAGRPALTLHVGHRSASTHGHISYLGPGQPVSGENNPWLAYQDLMGLGSMDSQSEDRLVVHRQSVLDLVREADVLIEGFRPGVMERLGLGPGDCHAVNRKLVYGRMTGWGQTGPRAERAGHDLNYIALSGALWYASLPGQPPVTPPTLVGDIGGGAMYLVAGMLAGLLRAGRTGQGAVVDAAIVDGSAHMLALLMSMAPAGMLSEGRGKSLLDGPHWSRSYACADGGFLSVQCLEAKFYADFLSILQLTDAPDFARQYDPATWPRATERLAALFATHPRAHWAALFDGTDACVAPVLSPWEAAQDPHLAARGAWTSAEGALQPAPAPRFSVDQPSAAPIPPRDAHRAQILDDLRARGLLDKADAPG